MEHTAEHFTPHKTSLLEFTVNIERYMFATQFIEGKTVLDLGCGAGLGTYFYSLFADKVIAVDYDATALEEARAWPYPKKNVEFLQLDLEDPETMAKLPEADVCIALEVLEHIEEPAAVLRELKAKKLIFGLPLYSLEVSKWHKYKIETEVDVRKLVQPYYHIGRYIEQGNPSGGTGWILGEGTRYEGN